MFLNHSNVQFSFVVIEALLKDSKNVSHNVLQFLKGYLNIDYYIVRVLNAMVTLFKGYKNIAYNFLLTLFTFEL